MLTYYSVLYFLLLYGVCFLSLTARQRASAIDHMFDILGNIQAIFCNF